LSAPPAQAIMAGVAADHQRRVGPIEAKAVASASGTSTEASYIGHRPALDGVRGLAILLVVGFHGGLPGMEGGFVGVQLFFVLSGFLITTLLLQESERRGRIALRRFYARRALRLLPALVVLLAAVLIYSRLEYSAAAAHATARDVWSSLLYIQNWFPATGHPVPLGLLDHAWSLAIEEQFYLIWPLCLILLLRLRLPRLAVVGIVAGGAVASAGWRLVEWQRGVPYGRMYYGTDTRADALLIGCAAGAAVAWGLIPRSRKADSVLHGLAILAIPVIALVVATGRFASGFLYGGGFTLVSVATAVLLVELVRIPTGALGRLFAHSSLTWAGRLSYSLYLWHWPVVIVFANRLSRWPNFFIDLMLAVALAECSYHLVEMPFLRLKRRLAPR
jgi:peptidoglycan/LPS O-acetylase OafA/YrhL